MVSILPKPFGMLKHLVADTRHAVETLENIRVASNSSLFVSGEHNRTGKAMLMLSSRLGDRPLAALDGNLAWATGV